MSEGNRPELTAEQSEIADFLLAEWNLQDYAEEVLTRTLENGQVIQESARWVIGFCGQHILDQPPEVLEALRVEVTDQIEQKRA